MAFETKSVTYDTASGKLDDPQSSLPGSATWWRKDLPKARKKGDPVVQVHTELIPYVKSLQTAWSQHDWFDRLHDRIYENRALLGLRKAQRALSAAGFDPARLMVTTSIVDTFHSRFERRRPMPMIVADDATYDAKIQAEEFQSFVNGKMHERGVDSVSSGGIKDAEIRGPGIAYVDEGDDDVVVELVDRWELFVDPHEASASKGGRNPEAVRQIHRVRRVAREVVVAMFPEHAATLRSTPVSSRRLNESGDEWTNPVGTSAARDLIDLYESWHLPSCTYDEDEGSEDDEERIDDGRKCIAVENATLCFERWCRPRFPFAILRRHYRQTGFWGQGDVERLAEDQADINRLARDIQRNCDFDGRMKVFKPQGLNMPTEKLTGHSPFAVEIPMGAGPPQYVAPNPVNPNHLGYLEKRISWMHDFVGVSQWSAQGRSPLGAGASGVALDTMEDIQSDRHASFEAEYARWRCEIAQLIIDACRSIARRIEEENKARPNSERRKFAATWMEHGTIERIEWDSEWMSDESYRIQIQPTSWMPTSVSGRFARLKELSQMPGIWSNEELLELYDMPDLASSSREKLAKVKNARRVMRMLGNRRRYPEVPMPEPEWGLELHKRMALDWYALACCEGADEETQARFRDYANACQDELDKAKTAAPGAGMPPMDPAAMGMPPGMPPGAGGPPMGPPMPGMDPNAPPMPMMPPGMPVAA
jgi:hypothetical protein